jgi:hypothetical protein
MGAPCGISEEDPAEHPMHVTGPTSTGTRALIAVIAVAAHPTEEAHDSRRTAPASRARRNGVVAMIEGIEFLLSGVIVQCGGGATPCPDPTGRSCVVASISIFGIGRASPFTLPTP